MTPGGHVRASFPNSLVLQHSRAGSPVVMLAIFSIGM